jgi:hypothetical protein
MTVQSKPVTQEVVAAAVRADVSIFEEADRDKRAHGGRSEEKDRSVKGD